MEDKYDKNGYGGSDFKRNTQQENKNENQHDQDGEDSGKLNEKTGEYMRELLSEKIKIDQSKFPISTKLLDQGGFKHINCKNYFCNLCVNNQKLIGS